MEFRIIKDEIKYLQQQNISEIELISIWVLQLYSRARVFFGKESKMTKNSLLVLKIYLQNVREENKYYHLLFQNYKKLDCADTLDFLDKLNEYKKNLLIYIEKSLSDIEVAIDMALEYRATLPKRNFKFLTETDEFQKEVVRLLLGEDILEDYFQLPDDFWEYISSKVIMLEEGDPKEFIGVIPKLDHNDYVQDLKIIVPQIQDMNTLLINIHEINHAYLIYQQLGNKWKEIDYEKKAFQEEKDFQEKYFEPIYKKIFNKKKNQFT